MEKPLIQVVIVKSQDGYDVILFDGDGVQERTSYEDWSQLLGDVTKAIMLLEQPRTCPR